MTTIIALGSWVIVPDVFGKPQWGRVEGYSFSQMCGQEDQKVYHIRGLDSLKLGFVERSAHQITFVLEG